MGLIYFIFYLLKLIFVVSTGLVNGFISIIFSFNKLARLIMMLLGVAMYLFFIAPSHCTNLLSASIGIIIILTPVVYIYKNR